MSLDLSYVIKYLEDNGKEEEEDMMKMQDEDEMRNNDVAPKYLSMMNYVEYIPQNENDQQYFFRLSLFLDQFLYETRSLKWQATWIPSLLRNLIQKCRNFPRCISILKIISVICENIEYTHYFKGKGTEIDQLKVLLKGFYHDLFEKHKEYRVPLTSLSPYLLST